MGSTEEFRKAQGTGESVSHVKVIDDVEATLRRDVEKAQGNLDRYLSRRSDHPPCESPGEATT